MNRSESKPADDSKLHNEEQGKNDSEIDINDKKNEEEILQLYQSFIETQLEDQRKEELKMNASEVI